MNSRQFLMEVKAQKKMFKRPWTEHEQSSKENKNTIGKSLPAIRNRPLKFQGQIMRKGDMTFLTFTSNIEGFRKKN